MSIVTARRALAAAGLLLSAAPVAAQVNEPVTLEALYEAAAARNPRVAAMRARADAVGARQPSAGTPADPYIEIGAMGLSLPGLSADMPTSMVPVIRVMQMVPLPGKLGASEEMARQDARMAEAEADAAWWETRAAIAMAFYETHSIDAQIGVMRETLRLLDDLQTVARAMYASGEGRQSDVLRASVEVARMDAEVRRMTAMRASAAADLAAALGDTALLLPSTSLSALPASLPGSDTLVTWAESSQPMLRGARAMVDRAAAARDLARRELWPDVTVGLEYGQRPGEMDMGTERMVGLMVGFSVPIFASRRQLPMRAEMEAMERMAAAELAQQRVQVAARIRGLVAELERARSLIGLYRAEILPQARANVESAYSAYRAGSVDFMTLVDARMAVNEFEQDVHELIAEYGSGISELEMTIGREIPLADAMDMETTP